MVGDEERGGVGVLADGAEGDAEEGSEEFGCQGFLRGAGGSDMA